MQIDSELSINQKLHQMPLQIPAGGVRMPVWWLSQRKGCSMMDSEPHLSSLQVELSGQKLLGLG